MTVTIEIPESLAAVLHESGQREDRGLLQEAVCGLYAGNRLDSAEASQMLGMTRTEFWHELARRKLQLRCVLELAVDLGASGGQSLRHVVMPQAWLGMVAGGILLFIHAMGRFVIPELMSGSKDILAGAALSVLIMLVMTAGLLVYFKLQRRILR